MNTSIKKSFTFLLADKLLMLLNRTPRVLFWHGVDNKHNPSVELEIFDINTFKKQIDYLRKNFEIISIEEFETRFKSNQFTNKEIVLTFDDGYANNLHIVTPILHEYKLPFTVFISTEHIATGELYPTSIARIIVKGAALERVTIPSQNKNYNLSSSKEIEIANIEISQLLKRLPLNEVRQITKDLISNVTPQQWEDLKERYKSVRPMDWQEVFELSKYATIGSHCKYHICCHSNQDEQEVKKQIFESKRNIEDNLNLECRYFAYPNGDFTDFSNRFVKEAGYKMGFSTDKIKIKPNKPLTHIPRIGVPEDINTFKMFTNLYPKK